MALTRIIVTGAWENLRGAIATGTVTFQLSCGISDGASLFYTMDPVVETLDEFGAISIRIPANDDPNTLPIGSHYIVTEKINGFVHTYFVIIPHTAYGGTVSLAFLAQPLPPSPFYSYVSTNEVGQPNGVASLDSVGRVPLGQLPGTMGGQNWAVNQQPLESPNGIRSAFTTPSAYLHNSLMVSLNGISEHYITEDSPTTFSFDEQPLSTDMIYLNYIMA